MSYFNLNGRGGVTQLGTVHRVKNRQTMRVDFIVFNNRLTKYSLLFKLLVVAGLQFSCINYNNNIHPSHSQGYAVQIEYSAILV